MKKKCLKVFQAVVVISLIFTPNLLLAQNPTVLPAPDAESGNQPIIDSKVMITTEEQVSPVLLEEATAGQEEGVAPSSGGWGDDWLGSEIMSQSQEPTLLPALVREEVNPTIQREIRNLEVKPAQIFSPIFSEVKNLIVNPAIVDDKVVYRLEKKNINKPIFRENEVLQPIFDLRVDQPVEFRLVDNKIIVNDEQVIDYKEIVREKEVMPPIELEINSAITDGKVHDLKVIPSPESAEFKFIYREKEVMMPVYSDFKVEDKKLYLIHNEEVHDLRVLPPEIYSAVYDLRVKEPKIVIKELSLKIENEKPIYDLRVEEPFKLFWIIPMKIKARYFIDPTDGSITNKERPWYHWLGTPNPLNQYGQLT
jgi:hypothetical protein